MWLGSDRLDQVCHDAMIDYKSALGPEFGTLKRQGSETLACEACPAPGSNDP